MRVKLISLEEKLERIEWKDEYNVGEETIDFQHKELVRLINNLVDSVGTAQQELLQEITLDELVKYTHNHFAQEESLMEKHNYAGIEPHKELHKGFIAKITDLKEQYSKGNSEINEGIFNFVRDWLLNHISKKDLEMVKAINK
jgi:hemerythrin-like metal-binding protein